AVRPPRMTVPLAPADFKLAVEELTIPAGDGVPLSAWLVARPAAPGVIFLHGYPAEKADMLPLAAALAPRFTVLLVDLRYFGKSGGRVTTLGSRERDDLRRGVDPLAARGDEAIGRLRLPPGGPSALLPAAGGPASRA